MNNNTHSTSHHANTAHNDDLLAPLRAQIDSIDTELLSLLDRRLALVAQIGAAKIQTNSSIYRPEREQAIITRLSSLPTTHLTKEAIEAIYHEIFAISRNLELPEKVAYLGPIGSYTHQAAEARFGAMSAYLPMNTISAVFSALDDKQARYGVVPIENNTNGIVGECIDNLATKNSKIIAEITLPIHLSFASVCEHITQIERIYSKDIAFGQCSRFLHAHSLHNIQQIPVESTAKAAQEARKDAKSAAICSHIAAKLYALPIMFARIQDVVGNKTRFVILSDFHNPPSGNDKTSIFARLHHFEKAGTLIKFLESFARANINLTKIDSRPLHAKEGFHSGFYVDFLGHKDEEHITKIFNEWGEQIRWLGSYPQSNEYTLS